MATQDIADRTLLKPKLHLADELLLQIFEHYQLPPAGIIGRNRYESLNVPKGPLIQNSPIKYYSDNDLHTGACTHQHEEWKVRLRTLSSISRVDRRFHRLALPLLYRVYPGQTLVNPQLFLRTLQQRADFALLVRELVLDPWDSINSPKDTKDSAKRLGLNYELVEFFQRTAQKWNDEPSAALLLLFCSHVETLTLTVPSAYDSKSAIFTLFKHLRRLGPNTLAKNNEQVLEWKNSLTDLPLRKLKSLHLHHAENQYIRKIKGLETLMSLPTLASVTAYRFLGDVPSRSALRRLREITLWRCSFRSDELLSVLESCSEIRSLAIISAGCTSMLGRLSKWYDYLDYNELGNIIRTKLKCLVKLRLDDREETNLGPRNIGSFKNGPALEELAINESCLGCFGAARGYEDSQEAIEQDADLSEVPLSELLPTSLRSLTIFRQNDWWHKSIDVPRGIEVTNDTLKLRYCFEAMHDKVFELLRTGLPELLHLNSIHIDTPRSFAGDLASFGWTAQQIVGDEKLERPSIVMDSLTTPEDKKEWEVTQDKYAATPSVLLRRVR